MSEMYEDDKLNRDPEAQPTGATPGARETYKLTEATIAWNYDSDVIKVGPGPVSDYWADEYQYFTGSCYPFIHELTPDQLRAAAFIFFRDVVVLAGVDAQAAHREFLKIDEYREGFAGLVPDAPEVLLPS